MQHRFDTFVDVYLEQHLIRRDNQKKGKEKKLAEKAS